jgi:hypothetical protein
MLYLRNLIEPFAMKLDTPEHVARGIVQAVREDPARPLPQGARAYFRGYPAPDSRPRRPIDRPASRLPHGISPSRRPAGSRLTGDPKPATHANPFLPHQGSTG